MSLQDWKDRKGYQGNYNSHFVSTFCRSTSPYIFRWSHTGDPGILLGFQLTGGIFKIFFFDYSNNCKQLQPELSLFSAAKFWKCYFLICWHLIFKSVEYKTLWMSPLSWPSVLEVTHRYKNQDQHHLQSRTSWVLLTKIKVTFFSTNKKEIQDWV